MLYCLPEKSTSHYHTTNSCNLWWKSAIKLTDLHSPPLLARFPTLSKIKQKSNNNREFDGSLHHRNCSSTFVIYWCEVCTCKMLSNFPIFVVNDFPVPVHYGLPHHCIIYFPNSTPPSLLLHNLPILSSNYRYQILHGEKNNKLHPINQWN